MYNGIWFQESEYEADWYVTTWIHGWPLSFLLLFPPAAWPRCHCLASCGRGSLAPLAGTLTRARALGASKRGNPCRRHKQKTHAAEKIPGKEARLGVKQRKRESHLTRKSSVRHSARCSEKEVRSMEFILWQLLYITQLPKRRAVTIPSLQWVCSRLCLYLVDVNTPEFHCCVSHDDRFTSNSLKKKLVKNRCWNNWLRCSLWTLSLPCIWNNI